VGGALISTVLGTKLPGPGATCLGQSLKFLKPVALGETVTATVTVAGKDPEKHQVTFDCGCTNEKGERSYPLEFSVCDPRNPGTLLTYSGRRQLRWPASGSDESHR